MKVVILAGGLGSRLSEETNLIPKPMVKIGGKPILWHIMKHYSFYGFNEFILLLGYKHFAVKEYFMNYALHSDDVSIDIRSGQISTLSDNVEPWKVTMLDTGLNTLTGGRIKRAQDHIGNETFLLTYGDGVSNIDLKKLIKFHESHNGSVTMSGVQPFGQFGTFEENNNQVESFLEKPQGQGSWVNGGFFVCNKKIFDYINNGDSSILEREPLENLAKNRQLFCYHHEGFWKCMDTMKDKKELQEMWDSGEPQWKIW